MSMLIAMVAANALATPSYPVSEVLTTFATACGEAEDLDATAAVLRTTGWQRSKKGDDTPLSQMLARRRGGQDSITETVGQFHKVVAGRTLYAFLSKTGYGGSLSGESTDCQIFDFDAPRALTTKELESWLGRKQERRRLQSDGSLVLTYPGMKPGHTWFSMWFVPSSAGTAEAFSGLSLAATVMKYEAFE